MTASDARTRRDSTTLRGSVAVALLATAALAGCGGGDDEPSSSVPPTPSTTVASDPGTAVASAITPAIRQLDLAQPEGLRVEVTPEGGRFNVVVLHELGPASPPNAARVRAKADATKILRSIYTGARKEDVARVVVRSSTTTAAGGTKTAYSVLMVGSTGRSLDWNASQARIERSWETPVDRL